MQTIEELGKKMKTLVGILILGIFATLVVYVTFIKSHFFYQNNLECCTLLELYSIFNYLLKVFGLCMCTSLWVISTETSQAKHQRLSMPKYEIYGTVLH